MEEEGKTKLKTDIYPGSRWLSNLNRGISLVCDSIYMIDVICFSYTLSVWLSGTLSHAPMFFQFEIGLLILTYLISSLNDTLTDWLYDRIYRHRDGRRVYVEYPLDGPFWDKFEEKFAEVRGYGFSAEVYLAHGTGYLQKEDLEEAFIYLCCAAELGNPEAMFYVGCQLLDGKHLMHNWRKGLELMRKSAEAGYKPGIIRTGRLCYYGKLVPQDFEEAAKWLQQGAELDDADSMFYLGQLYLDGTGVAHDPDKALEFLCQASNLGHAKATRMIEKLDA